MPSRAILSPGLMRTVVPGWTVFTSTFFSLPSLVMIVALSGMNLESFSTVFRARSSM